MPQSAEQILQQEFLLARAKILELAATFDRIDRASGDVSQHPQMQLLQSGLDVLTGGEQTDFDQASRAERVQLLFSRQYSTQWRQSFGI